MKNTTGVHFLFGLLWSVATRLIFLIEPYTDKWYIYTLGGGVLVIVISHIVYWRGNQ